MADADLELTASAVTIRDGELNVPDAGATFGGRVEVRNTTGQPAASVEVGSSGEKGKLTVFGGPSKGTVLTDGDKLMVKRSDGTVAVEITTGFIKIRNTSGALSFLIDSNGTTTFYSDVALYNNADIKLDGQFLSSRLDDIESRLDALET
jgi:hypothetical protein